MSAEEECVEGYFREKDSKLQMCMEERVKSINERVEHISQKVEDVIQKETAHTAAYQVRPDSAAACPMSLTENANAQSGAVQPKSKRSK